MAFQERFNQGVLQEKFLSLQVVFNCLIDSFSPLDYETFELFSLVPSMPHAYNDILILHTERENALLSPMIISFS